MLSTHEVAQFHEQGYLGPYTLCSLDEMAVTRSRIETEVLTSDGPNPKTRLQCRHLDQRFLYDLCALPAIVDRAESLLGPDLVLWATYFFNKEPGGSEIPWHQDFNYWPLEPVVNLSAWLAVDEVTIENSCVNLIPGSHKKIIKHLPSREGMAFGEEADPAQVDASKAIPMELAPGEFFLFNERTLHQSNKNMSQKRRMGMTMRITVPFVKMTHDNSPLFPGHANIQLRGTDHLGFNRLTLPPETNP